MSLPIKRNPENSVGDFIQNHLVHSRVHPRSLVSTFFGDVVMPNDGYTWVETICAVFKHLSVNERLVRTSLFRMREEGWLDSTRSGRKSFYQLTERAMRQTRLAERLIYHRDLPSWDGSWTLVFLTVEKIDPEVRKEFVQELGWVGFGAVTKGVWAHPSVSKELVGELLEQLDLSGKVICMRCENIRDVNLGLPIDDRQLAAMCMPVAEVEDNYSNFVRNYSHLLSSDDKLNYLGSDTELLSLRLMMVDEFRRMILKDPHLPVDLLPENWAGRAAFELCATIYRQLIDTSNAEYRRLQEQAGEPPKGHIQENDEAEYEHRFQVS